MGRGAQKGHDHWTREVALAAGVRFLEREGRVPKANECRIPLGLPSYNTLLGLFGSVTAYQQQILQHGPTAPPALPQRHCLRCGVRGPDWMCATCKKTEEWREGSSVAWMNGVAAASWDT